MKQSIKKIFKNLNLYMLFILFISFVALMLTLEHQLSVQKVSNLNNQKDIILSLTKLEKEDVELALILFQGRSAQLNSDIDKLRNAYKYNVTGKYILKNGEAYNKDLKRLRDLVNIFNKNAHSYIKTGNLKKDRITKQRVAKENMKKSFYAVNAHIEEMKIEDMRYNEAVFMLFEKPIVFSFILVLLGTFLYRKRINDTYKDIEFLSSTEKNYAEYQIFSIEADAISSRMKRKAVTADNPAFIDQMTGINNHDGMLNAYGDKKGMKEQNFTSVTVIEIDNFSKSKRTYNQELTQVILKKIAFTLSLHEQPTDVIARTDYNQFTIIFSRDSKEQAYKDVEIIRQSISELKFKTPKDENITVCGGYVIKPSHTSLEEAIKKAKEILNYTKSVTRNKIYQTKDIAKQNL
jgi:diguanylate cyclase (GGDEF)-like protein